MATTAHIPQTSDIITIIQRIGHALPLGYIALALVAVEIASFAGHEFHLVNIMAFCIIVLVTLLLALRSLHTGMLVAVAELVLGSQGHLFTVSLAHVEIPLRLGIFLAIMVAYGVAIVRDRRIGFFQWPLHRPVLLFIGLLGIATLTGVLYENNLRTLFFDMNGYLYFGLLGPLTQTPWTARDRDRYLAVLFIAAGVLFFVTIFFLILFAQMPLIPYTARGLYTWIRDTRLGEITRFDNGFGRVFLQSHVYAVIVFFLCGTLLMGRTMREVWRHRELLVVMGFFILAGLVIFVSYSRSFWVGTFITLSLFLLYAKRIAGLSWRKLGTFFAFLVVTAVLDFGLVAALVNIPFPGHERIAGLLSERTQNIVDEPAAASRYQSLVPLRDAMRKHPLFGSGFGATVTYTSRDWRVLEVSPSGIVTTSAVEWGYLDMMLKFGALGMLIFGWLVWRVSRVGWRFTVFPNADAMIAVGMLFGLLSIAIIHALTPYLNHPLGLGWLMLCMLLFIPRFRTIQP